MMEWNGHTESPSKRWKTCLLQLNGYETKRSSAKYIGSNQKEVMGKKGKDEVFKDNKKDA